MLEPICKPRIIHLCCLFGVSLLYLNVGSAQIRKFTSTTGQTLEGQILFVQGDKVIFQKPNKAKFTIPISRFQSEDQAYIRDWQDKNKGKPPAHLKNKKPQLEMVVTTGKTNKDDDKESGYVNERKQKVGMKVVLENEDAIYPIQDAKLTVMVIGVSPETRKNAIVSKEVFKGVNLPLNEEKTYEGKKFELWYDDYGAMYGHKWKGYIVVLQDPEGKILGEKTIPGSAEKYLVDALQLKAGDVFDNRYRRSGSVSLSKSVRNRR